jgi:hypothetical protein
MKVRFYDINWDTDGASHDLPKEVTMHVDDDIDVSLEGADALSDKYGWCINSFNFEILTKTFKDSSGHTFSTSNPVHIQFIKDMEAAGFSWMTYSGRGMYGRQCPAVVVGRNLDEADVMAATRCRGFSRDNMGLDFVIYLQRGEIRPHKPKREGFVF